MYVKNDKSVLVILVIIINICNASNQHDYIKEHLNSIEYHGKPFFQNKIYTANIDGISFELHDPIVLNNCDYIDPSFELDISQSNYIPVVSQEIGLSPNNCTLMFPKIFIKRNQVDKEHFAGFITVKALHKNRTLDVTSVVLIQTPYTNDLRLIFDINGTEYVILNYFHVKIIFLGLLVTAILLMIVELTDIYDKIKRNKYKPLEETNP